jgi:hypothetical protein
VAKAPCGSGFFGDDSVHLSGYLSARPGADPLDRLPQLTADLQAQGWAVTYPVRLRERADRRLLSASRDGYDVRVDVRYPPVLTVNIMSPCYRSV